MQTATNDWRRQPRGQYQIEPPPNLVSAIAAYIDGETTTAIVAQFGVGFPQLYRWLERMDVPLRKRVRIPKIKAGRPREKPLNYYCKWCDGPLSIAQIKLRRKYCGDFCRKQIYVAYHEAQREKRRQRGDVRGCPGCEAEVWEDRVYCSNECYEATLRARIEAKNKEILRLAKLPTRLIMDRLGIKRHAVKYRLKVAMEAQARDEASNH